MTKLGETNSQDEITKSDEAGARGLIAALPVYSSLAAATVAGVTSGQAFVLSGVVLGIETVKIVVIKP